MNIDLSGKNVLVTGASRGIGYALAEALSASGARVALSYNSNRQKAEALAQKLDHAPLCIQANLGDPESCNRLFQQTVAEMGRLHVLINNAGISPATPLDTSPPEQWLNTWNEIMAVNLRATEHLCRLAIPHFQGHASGRIINIASRAAFRGDTADYMTYAASKGGVVALTRSIARAFGKDGIAAFVIAPGFVNTDMAQDFVDAYGESYILDDIALPTLTEPKDLGPMIVLLASGLADHATGATIDINAGSYVH